MGASLLSVSAMNVLRSQSLPNTDFRDPGQVLQGLNATFNMDLHDNKYFTIWYGVYRTSTRQLLYAGGGHPPALLCMACDDGRSGLKPLDSTGPIIGMMPDLPFDTQSVAVEPEAKLYLFSDGVFEIDQPDGDDVEIRGVRRVLLCGDAARKRSWIACSNTCKNCTVPID